MYFKSENTKLNTKSYLVLSLLLVAYFLIGGYSFNLFPKEVSVAFVGLGLFVSVLFLFYFLRNNV